MPSFLLCLPIKFVLAPNTPTALVLGTVLGASFSLRSIVLMGMCVPEKPEESFGSLGTGIPGGFQPLAMGA